MLTLHLSTALVYAGTTATVRLTDLTDWTQAPSPRASWALFLTGAQLGSTQAQDATLAPASYDPVLFASGSNPAGTVDVPLPADGVFALRAVALPVLADATALAGATHGRAYYRLDTQQFLYVSTGGQAVALTGWADVVDAAGTDNGSGADTQNLLEKSTVQYVLADAGLQAGLAMLNLRYLEAGPRQRGPLQQQYSQVELLGSGAARQKELGFYADASTTLTAAQRLLGACLPDYASSLPALGQLGCGCH